MEVRTPTFTLGDRLVRSRKDALVSPEQMALEMGVDKSTISRWENDKVRPKDHALKVWAMRCGVPFDWLKTGDLPGGPGSLSEALGQGEHPTSWLVPDLCAVAQLSDAA